MKHGIGIRLISSQRRVDFYAVSRKIAEEDYSVYVVIFSIEDKEFGVILDGHHSLRAAEMDCVVPEWELTDFCLVTEEGTDLGMWLMDMKIDTEYYDWDTKEPIEKYLMELYQKDCEKII